MPAEGIPFFKKIKIRLNAFDFRLNNKHQANERYNIKRQHWRAGSPKLLMKLPEGEILAVAVEITMPGKLRFDQINPWLSLFLISIIITIIIQILKGDF